MTSAAVDLGKQCVVALKASICQSSSPFTSVNGHYPLCSHDPPLLNLPFWHPSSKPTSPTLTSKNNYNLISGEFPRNSLHQSHQWPCAGCFLSVLIFLDLMVAFVTISAPPILAALGSSDSTPSRPNPSPSPPVFCRARSGGALLFLTYVLPISPPTTSCFNLSSGQGVWVSSSTPPLTPDPHRLCDHVHLLTTSLHQPTLPLAHIQLLHHPHSLPVLWSPLKISP